MPIIRMAYNRDEIPADAQNIRLADARAYNLKRDLWLYDTHVGLCLEERENNRYDDSDFTMIVWNPVEQKPETITFATTRAWSYPCYGSRADATPEVREAYAAFKRERDERQRQEAEARAAAVPNKGKRVRVTRQVRGKNGRPAGTEGVVFWADLRPESPLGGKMVGRVGVDAGGDRFFANASDVEVVK